MSKKKTTRYLMLAASMPVVLFAWVSGSSSEEPGRGDSPQVRAQHQTSNSALEASGIFHELRERHALPSRAGGLSRTPREAMPQVQYSIDGAEPVVVADGFVVGDVISVEEGRSFRWEMNDEGEERVQLGFNEDAAQVSTLHVTLRVSRSIVAKNRSSDMAESLTVGEDVRFGLALAAPADPAAAERELLEAGSLVALLYKGSSVFDYDPDLWAVVQDGAYLGVVQDGNIVHFPVLDGPEQAHHTGQDGQRASYRLEELEAPQRDGPTRVTHNPESGRYER